MYTQNSFKIHFQDGHGVFNGAKKNKICQFCHRILYLNKKCIKNKFFLVKIFFYTPWSSQKCNFKNFLSNFFSQQFFYFTPSNCARAILSSSLFLDSEFACKSKHCTVRFQTVQVSNSTQSICTHYSCFENMGRFVTLKKIRSKIWVTKSRVQKNRVIVILLFLNNQHLSKSIMAGF